MDRRNFLKFSAVGGATVAFDACGKPEHQLIRFIPEEELTPGMAVWKPGVCVQCRAGCGLRVRVMEGEAEVTRHGQLGLIKMGLAKKLEGNPGHPINQGKLCAWGQAGLQVTYNPDRIRFPLKRSGPRGSGEYQAISWEEATRELAGHLASLSASQKTLSLTFLARPLRGQRAVLIGRFLSAFSGSRLVSFEFFEEAVLRRANALSFGHYQLPTFDLANANYVVSFGTDFLGTWNSPVAQNRGYGTMRRGRPGQRAKFVQIESRMSQTGANSDEWVYARPGTEGMLALGLANVMLSEKLRPAAAAGRAGTLLEGWTKGLADYTPDNVEKRTGVEAAKIRRLAREMARHLPSVAIIGGAALAQTNGLANALAVNALNALLGSAEKTGGIYFTPQPPMQGAASSKKEGTSIRELSDGILKGSAPVEALLVYDANPVFASPPAWRVREALEKIPFIASFGSFVDETSILADLILPDHSYLESWIDSVPESGTTLAVASLAPPAMLPLHHTRAMPDVLLDVAGRLGGEAAKALPWKTYEEMLQAAFAPLRKQPGSVSAQSSDDFWEDVQAKGGWWSAEVENPPETKTARPLSGSVKVTEPQFDGSAQEYPFNLLPYASLQFGDGTHANLPWMQEMPEVLSTAMWSTWVEINTQTAERLGIQQGELVEVASRHGKLQAPALVSPGIAPDVVAMPVGQGHENYGRYASRRGANAIKILAAQTEPGTGALAWAATRVKITRAGKQGKLILFAGGLREWPREYRHR